MKKIILLIFAAGFTLMACNSGEDTELEQMYEAFNRNHEELRNDMERGLDDISASDNRDIQLDLYYNDLIPRIDDFKTVITNYEFGSTEHLELQESMLAYIDSLENLTRKYGQFNLNFYVANPLDDEDFSVSFQEDLDEIRQLEVEVDNNYEMIEEQYKAIKEK